MVSNFKNTVRGLANTFEDHVHQRGLDEINRSGDAAKNVNSIDFLMEISF